MARTVADIAKRVKRQFGDESGVQVTDSDVILWLNDAIREAVSQNRSANIELKYLALIQGRSSYVLGCEFESIHDVRVRGSLTQPYSSLAALDSVEMRRLLDSSITGVSTTTGTPSFYGKIDSSSISVYPAPSHSDGIGLLVYANVYPSEVTSETNNLPLSDRYFQYYLEYCLMKAYEMDEDWAAADRKMQYVQSTLNSAHTWDMDVSASTYPTITETQNI